LLPRDHRSQPSPHPEPELANESFIRLPNRPRGCEKLLVSAGQHAGFEPRVTLESNESQRIGGSSPAGWP